VVNIFYSNYDIKGKPVTDWNLIGLISANLEVEFPYRALLPQGLEGILVTGKAFSAGSDATPLIRMQADLENLGGVTGLAAALSIQAGGAPRALDVRLLQERLVAIGLLPADVLTRAIQPRRLSPAELREWIERLDAAQPLYDLNNRPGDERFHGRIPIVEVCSAGPQAIPLLAQALETAEGPRQVLVAQALAMCGDPTGAPVLVEAIQAALGETGLPPRSAHILNAVKLMPDQAAMPDAAYLVYSLGMTRSRSVLEVCQAIANRLDFNDAGFRDPNHSPYHYIDAVCYCLERLGAPEGIPILQKIHAHPLLHDQVCRQGIQADFMIERLATMELVIARALARCGSPEGYAVLIAYLDDVRALLAEHAHRELASITGQDFGKDPTAWQVWLEQTQAHLPPRPWLAPTDAQREW
jgi:hypothetical protein